MTLPAETNEGVGEDGSEGRLSEVALTTEQEGGATVGTEENSTTSDGDPSKERSSEAEARPARFSLHNVVENSLRSIQSAVSEVFYHYTHVDDDSGLTAPFLVSALDLSDLANERTRAHLADVLEKALESQQKEESNKGPGDLESAPEGVKIRAQLKGLISRLRIAADHGPYPESSKEAANADRDAELAAMALTSFVLRSTPDKGLNPAPIGLEHRRSTFGYNAIAEKKLDSFLKLCFEAVQDFVLIMLIALGVISIVIETTIALGPEDKCGACFVEGLAILTSVCIVVLVTAGIDYTKQFAFIRLTKSLDATNTKVVIRGGEQYHVTDADIVVGDILSVNSHNLASIPADCVLLGPASGSYLKVDESSLTGESKQITKKPGDVVLSGTNAAGGGGKMVVIAVGINSVAGKIKARVYESETLKESEHDDIDGDEESPLFSKLTLLAKQIGIVGTVAAVLAFLAMCIIGLGIKGEAPQMLVEYFVVAVTVLAVAVPEGLPLAVTLALAFSSNKMMKDHNLVKHLDACETMGCATTICTDKTGTLTTNKMTVRAIFVNNTNITCTDPSQSLGSHLLSSPKRPSEKIIQLLSKLISIDTMNETALTFSEKDGSVTGSTGNPTECALLALIYDLGHNYREIRESTRGRTDVGEYAEHLAEGRQIGFSSARKMMSWAVPLFEAGEIYGYRLFSKGAAEVMLSRSTSYLVDTPQEENAVEPLDSDTGDAISEIVEKYAQRGMRCIGLAYRDLPVDVDFEEKHDTAKNSDGTEAFATETEMTFAALVGIEDPLRPEVPDAIRKCYEAGIDVRMVTGDSPNTAVSIAYQAGILKPYHFIHPENITVSTLGEGDGPDENEMVASNLKENILMEGKTFRQKVYKDNSEGKKEFDQAAFDDVWPYLRVLARSSPDDKLTLAHGLNQSVLFSNKTATRFLSSKHNIKIFPDRQVVAMTGDGTNDAPALKRADIGFAMGISGTQIAKDAADIILLDDNFASIVTAAKWGRNVYASIQKFIQFQLTVNISAVITALVGAFSYQKSPLAAIQLLWVNLIMDSLASLALASEPPVDELLQRPPVNRSEYIIKRHMWANMLGQSAYQISVIMVLLFEGPDILNLKPGHLVEREDGENSEHYTIIFNAFVWMQLFNEINCRQLRGEFWVCKGILNNPLFCFILVLTAVLQVIMVQFGSYALHVVEGGLSWQDWVLCLVLGAISLPVQQIINLIFILLSHYNNWRENKRMNKNRNMIYRNVPSRSERSTGSIGSKED